MLICIQIEIWFVFNFLKVYLAALHIVPLKISAFITATFSVPQTSKTHYQASNVLSPDSKKSQSKVSVLQRFMPVLSFMHMIAPLPSVKLSMI